MAALTDAMKWYNLGGLKAARTKYHFKVEFFSSAYTAPKGNLPALQAPARLIFDCIRTVELPKYSIETEVINAWNVRQLVPTKIVFEPISLSFTDTLDNRFQKFIKSYMNIISGSFTKQTQSLRKEYDDFGLRQLEADCPIDRIEITRFYGADAERNSLSNKSKVTLWRPKIVDVQHDTLDYSASEAVTWQISLRYESVTYEEEGESNMQASSRGEDPAKSAAVTAKESTGAPVDTNASNASSGNDNSYNAVEEARLARQQAAAQAQAAENQAAAEQAAATQAREAEAARAAQEAATAEKAKAAETAREEAKTPDPAEATREAGEKAYQDAYDARNTAIWDQRTAEAGYNVAAERLKTLESREGVPPEQLERARQRVAEAESRLATKNTELKSAKEAYSKAYTASGRY